MINFVAQQKKLVIPAISLVFLPAGLPASLLMAPVSVYRPILSALLSHEEMSATEALDDETVRLLISQELVRSLEHSWRTYRLRRGQAKVWAFSLLQQKPLAKVRRHLLPYRADIREFSVEKFDDIFPDPVQIQLSVLLRAKDRYAYFLRCVRAWCRHLSQFWDYLESRMLPQPDDILLYLQRYQDRPEFLGLRIRP